MFSRTLKSTLVLSLTALVLWAANPFARAQGILFPRPEIHTQPFYVKDLHVHCVINDAVAETTVEQTFVNASSVQQEGTYLYPLPEGASPTSFTMTVGDKTMEPRVLSKEEADTIYAGYVRRYRDPALLEYVGRNLVKISVFPIPAQGERVIRMRYTEILKPQGDLRKYAYSLSTSRFGSRPVGVSTVSIKLHTSSPLKNIYSPTHDLSVRKQDDKNATASWEGTNDISDRDLELYYSTSADDVGLSLLTYRSGDHDGYFMLLAAPRVSIPKERILSKQVVFVLDRTGSMTGKKIEQAKKSLLYCLNNLNPTDRFDVITFNESPDVLSRELMPATRENVQRAKAFVENVEASGGTNIDDALHAALGLVKNVPGHEKMIVFLTDGLPTIGETNINTILAHVKEENGSHTTALRTSGLRTVANAIGRNGDIAPARIFCFGLGYDVNVPFLDRLADQARGDADYIKPEEDVESRVTAFYSKVASPVLSDIKLSFDGADVYDVYPKTLPDLFKGSQLVVTGRFRNAGKGTAHLSGVASGSTQSFALGAPFGAGEGENNYLPRIWAARKLGYLVDQIRLSENPDGKKEILDEIVRLSREYGIITEYTSFLVDEPEQIRLGLRDSHGRFDANKLSENSLLRKELVNRSVQYGYSGAGVTDQSLRAKDLQNAARPYSRYQAANGSVSGDALGRDLSDLRARGGNSGSLNGGPGFFGGYRADLSSSQSSNVGTNDARNVVTLQAVGDRTFYLKKNVWQDHSFDAKKQSITKIEAFSEAHFALIKAMPSLAMYSSVGKDVIVRIGSNAIQIGGAGKSSLTTGEVNAILRN